MITKLSFIRASALAPLVLLFVAACDGQERINPNGVFRDLREAAINGPVCRSLASPNQKYVDDWSAPYLKAATGGDSVRRNLTPYTNIWTAFTNDAYAARLSGDKALADKVADALNESARRDLLMATPTISEARSSGMQCYRNGDTSQPCPTHLSQTATEYFTAAVLSAILIAPVSDKLDREKFNRWIDRGFSRYVEPLVDDLDQGNGINEFMGYRMSLLLRAIWTGDARAFRRNADAGIRRINRYVDQNGRIDNSSYRGVRAVFYHSLGVDAMLGFGELLESQGIPFYSRSDIGPKVRASYSLALAAARDYHVLEDLGPRGRNVVMDEKDARRRLHPLSTSITWIGAQRYSETGGFVPRDGLDAINGILPNCLYADQRNWIMKLGSR